MNYFAQFCRKVDKIQRLNKSNWSRKLFYETFAGFCYQNLE